MTEAALKVIYQNKRNNAQGHFFEKEIEQACKKYKEEKVANIEKTPEPFRVLSKNYKDGTFKGRFISHAQPDFKGTLKNGKSVVFEAKYTGTDRIKSSVLTRAQAESLETHHKLGAVAGVCVGIKDRYFFVPWEIWRDMKKHIGKQSATAEDLKQFEIYYRYGEGVRFLEHIQAGREGVADEKGQENTKQDD